MTDLGTLPGGSSSSALDINERGQVVGQADNGSVGLAFLWQQGTMIGLGTLGGSHTTGIAINDSGQIVGQGILVSGESHAVLWTK